MTTTITEYHHLRPPPLSFDTPPLHETPATIKTKLIPLETISLSHNVLDQGNLFSNFWKKNITNLDSRQPEFFAELKVKILGSIRACVV